MSRQVTFEDILNEIKDLARGVTPAEAGKKVCYGLMHTCHRAKEIDLLNGGCLVDLNLRRQSDYLHFLCPGSFEMDGQIMKCGCWCHRNRQ